MWMQSEPRRPEAYSMYVGGHEVKRAPQIAIPPCGLRSELDMGTRCAYEADDEGARLRSLFLHAWRVPFCTRVSPGRRCTSVPSSRVIQISPDMT